MKIKWKVDPAPVGRFAWSYGRSWPMAENENGNPMARIEHVQNYTPSLAKDPGNDSLSVFIACWNNPRTPDQSAFDWKRLKKRFSTVADAKQGAKDFILKHPEYHPQEDA